jgi:hypothetical protein
MKTAQNPIDYPAIIAAIAAELDATVTDRATHRFGAEARPQASARYLTLADGLVICAKLDSEPRGGPYISFDWDNYPKDGNTMILPREAVTNDSGPAPDTYTRVNASRPPLHIARQVTRKVIEPARLWLPNMLAVIERRRLADRVALEAARAIAAAFNGRPFDEDGRDRRGHAHYVVWLGLDQPWSCVTINGYGDGSVSIYPDRMSGMNVAQLVAMCAAYRTHKDAAP